MKKILLTIGFIGCLMMYTTVPVSAEIMNGNDNTPGQELRHNVNRGINDTNRALGTDFNRTNNNGTTMNANNYRTNAATDNDGFDWGWLGLLGLLGLAGMRNRVGDRDRA